MPATQEVPSRLERWAPGHLDRIDTEIAEHVTAIADGPKVPDNSLRHAIAIEGLRFEASLIRLLVADRETGVASMYYDLRPSQSGHSTDIERARIRADMILSFLSLHGNMFTDEELRRAMCGPTALPFRG